MGESRGLSKEDFIALLGGINKGEFLVFVSEDLEDEFRLTTDNTLFAHESDICEWCKDTRFAITSKWEDEDSKTTVVVNVGEYEKKYRRDSDEIYLVRKGGGYAKVSVDLKWDNSAKAKIEEFDTLIKLAGGSDWSLIHTMVLSERMSRLEAKVDLLLTHLMYMPGGEGAAEAGEHFEMVQKI